MGTVAYTVCDSRHTSYKNFTSICFYVGPNRDFLKTHRHSLYFGAYKIGPGYKVCVSSYYVLPSVRNSTIQQFDTGRGKEYFASHT